MNDNKVFEVMEAKIIVTGAGGLIGRAVCAHLSSQGIAILPVVRSKSELYENQTVLDLSNGRGLLDSVKGPVAGIIHLAAAVPHSSIYPDTKESSNLTRRMDDAVVSAARFWNCSVIYMSSCGLYDRLSPEVKYENSSGQIKIESPYFSAKYDGEKKFMINTDAVIFRLAAPIGEGLRAGLVVSRFIELARQDKAIQVWGTGLREQNFIDAVDVADIVVKAIKKPISGIYNIASKCPSTMRNLAKSVIDAVGSGRVEFPGIQDPRDKETARYSIELVEKTYGWSPEISLENSLRRITKIEFKG